MVARVLEELDGLLNEEERALIAIDLDTVVALAGRKSELVQQVETELARSGEDFPADAADLARGLLAVLSDREWAVKLGRNARKRVWQEFDWDARVGEVERAYRIALSSGVS